MGANATEGSYGSGNSIGECCGAAGGIIEQRDTTIDLFHDLEKVSAQQQGARFRMIASRRA